MTLPAFRTISTCGRRLLLLPLALGLLLGLAAPASAQLTYVLNLDGRADDGSSVSPSVWVSGDDGSGRTRLGAGTQPRISQDGRWVAWRTVVGSRQRLQLSSTADDAERPRTLVSTAAPLGVVRFSPDGTLLAVQTGRRLRVYETETGRGATLVSGSIEGFTFAPDGSRIVFGLRDADDADTDLYTVPTDGGQLTRLTDDGRSSRPVWGPDRIAYDRRKAPVRGSTEPAYDVWTLVPEVGRPHRVTSLKVPSGASGLVPIAWAADGRRLLAQYFAGTEQVGFAVNPFTGRTKAVRTDQGAALVAFGLRADGRTVLAQTGGVDPAARHDVVEVPYDGGRVTTLVRDAAQPSWSD